MPEPIKPEPGQESVWDYPRPPRLEPTARHIRVVCGGMIVADTRRALRVLETSHPPTYYIPPQDVQQELLIPRFHTTLCEWKGTAHYYGLMAGDRLVDVAAWYYITPTPAYAALAMHIAFFPGLMDGCYVDGEKVTPQPGTIYGGWITSDIVGPFKGDPGTEYW